MLGDLVTGNCHLYNIYYNITYVTTNSMKTYLCNLIIHSKQYVNNTKVESVMQNNGNNQYEIEKTREKINYLKHVTKHVTNNITYLYIEVYLRRERQTFEFSLAVDVNTEQTNKHTYDSNCMQNCYVKSMDFIDFIILSIQWHLRVSMCSQKVYTATETAKGDKY